MLAPQSPAIRKGTKSCTECMTFIIAPLGFLSLTNEMQAGEEKFVVFESQRTRQYVANAPNAILLVLPRPLVLARAKLSDYPRDYE